MNKQNKHYYYHIWNELIEKHRFIISYEVIYILNILRVFHSHHKCTIQFQVIIRFNQLIDYLTIRDLKRYYYWLISETPL